MIKLRLNNSVFIKLIKIVKDIKIYKSLSQLRQQINPTQLYPLFFKYKILHNLIILFNFFFFLQDIQYINQTIYNKSIFMGFI